MAKPTPKWMLDPISEHLIQQTDEVKYCGGCGQEIHTAHILDWKCGDCWKKEFDEYQSVR